MAIVQLKCEFCGAAFAASQAGHRVCSKACNTARTNLRRLRCDRVHDLLMRRVESYRNRGLITEIDRMCRSWRDEDRAAGKEDLGVSEELLCADDNCPSAVSCWRYMRNFYTAAGRRVWVDFEREPEAVGCEAYQPITET